MDFAPFDSTPVDFARSNCIPVDHQSPGDAGNQANCFQISHSSVWVSGEFNRTLQSLDTDEEPDQGMALSLLSVGILGDSSKIAINVVLRGKKILSPKLIWKLGSNLWR